MYRVVPVTQNNFVVGRNSERQKERKVVVNKMFIHQFAWKFTMKTFTSSANEDLIHVQQCKSHLVIFSFPSHIFMPLVNWWPIRPQGQFPIVKTICCPGLYLIIPPPRSQLAKVNPYSGIHLVPSYFAHSLFLEGVGKNFPLTEMRLMVFPTTFLFISREKFEPRPEFELRSSRSLAWRSTT